MTTLTLALHAMATRFEMVLHGENPVALRAAGEEALAEIERLEAQLSLYRDTSEIAHLNARAAQGPVRVTPSLFALLLHAQQLHRQSGGAFDITIAPLVRCWGFMGGGGHLPDAAALAAARASMGMSLVELDPDQLTVRFASAGVMLDLGAIGKGYAVDRAIDILREAAVASALLHGGTSTVFGLGHPPDAESWKVAVECPRHGMLRARAGVPPGRGQDARATLMERARAEISATIQPQRAPGQTLATVPLRDEAMSVSAVWGRSFQAEGKTFGHVLDPRTGCPVSEAVLAAVVLPSATETDALSTALLVLGMEGRAKLAGLRPGMKSLLAAEARGQFRVESDGLAITGVR
ncbi:MAG TPA: FAD:protein FMN transferase [Dongiaceae bacterium]|nr:FAD:protein FMN transferase [Dongiaceae bacterium]